MNIKKNTNNLFAKWKEINRGICYYTRSPFPDQDYYFSSEPKPYCTNSASYIYSKFKVDEVSFYIREQLAILKFNNPKLDNFHLESIFKNRILNWEGNNELKEFLNEFNHMQIFDNAIAEVLNAEDLSRFIEFDYRKHWFGTRVVNLPENQNIGKWGKRRREKHKLRTSYASQQKRNKIEKVSLEYQNENFGILPKVADIKEASDLSDYDIKTYGKGLFLPNKENTKQKVVKYLELHSDLTYREIAEKYNISERTVKRYSEFKKMNDDNSGELQSESAKN